MENDKAYKVQFARITESGDIQKSFQRYFRTNKEAVDHVREQFRFVADIEVSIEEGKMFDFVRDPETDFFAINAKSIKRCKEEEVGSPDAEYDVVPLYIEEIQFYF